MPIISVESLSTCLDLTAPLLVEFRVVYFLILSQLVLMED